MVDDGIRVDLANDGRQRLGELEQRGMDHPACEYHALDRELLLTTARPGKLSTSLLS